MSTRPESLATVSDIDCTGCVALVTGSTSGIGRVAAHALGRLGAKVIVHGRDRAAGEEVVRAIHEDGGEATFVAADFTEADEIRALAETVRARTDGLDLLLNNAGGLFRQGRLVEGIERTFYVNHLAPYLLTADLLGHLREGARVVTTASEAHRGAQLDLERPQALDGYSGMGAYAHSKLANVLFASELARRLEATDRSITSNSLHPGFVPGSQFGRFLPGPLAGLFRMLDLVPGTSSVADGAAELLHVAVSPDTEEVSGRYFSGQSPTRPAAAARDREAAVRLWRRSAELLKMEEPLSDVEAPPERPPSAS
ncbi:SDR family NAD(P)-dependent oxidoreductase [Salinibacter altiplanensis]|uniref:SDR family NAD(P)-dependent oxidoreductase n=1 Tax=Salinibacter altiplanensis TaxID=1803181 RepID=UPI000C9F0E0B|nr:SDR family NAD(P)-dependent oxidoreductase [Salinibacter altiplanensis]